MHDNVKVMEIKYSDHVNKATEEGREVGRATIDR